jgi:transcriptional regulator with XRE-family HTH domain
MESYQTQAIDEIIGLRLRARRKSLKVTQKELAEMLGVTFQQVQKYENGKCRISLSTFVKMCAGLRTNPNYFFDTIVLGDDVYDIDGDLEERLLAIFRSVGNRQVKARIVELVAAIAMNTNMHI